MWSLCISFPFNLPTPNRCDGTAYRRLRKTTTTETKTQWASRDNRKNKGKKTVAARKRNGWRMYNVHIKHRLYAEAKKMPYRRHRPRETSRIKIREECAQQEKHKSMTGTWKWIRKSSRYGRTRNETRSKRRGDGEQRRQKRNPQPLKYCTLQSVFTRSPIVATPLHSSPRCLAPFAQCPFTLRVRARMQLPIAWTRLKWEVPGVRNSTDYDHLSHTMLPCIAATAECRHDVTVHMHTHTQSMR